MTADLPGADRELLRVYYGDRVAAMQEMLTGGDLDYLTGDYLAELTMLILGRDRMKNPDRGTTPRPFWCNSRSAWDWPATKVSGSWSTPADSTPAGLAQAVRALADRLGVPTRVAHVEGDDLLPRAAELGFPGVLTRERPTSAPGASSTV